MTRQKKTDSCTAVHRIRGQERKNPRTAAVFKKQGHPPGDEGGIFSPIFTFHKKRYPQEPIRILGAAGSVRALKMQPSRKPPDRGQEHIQGNPGSITAAGLKVVPVSTGKERKGDVSGPEDAEDADGFLIWSQNGEVRGNKRKGKGSALGCCEHEASQRPKQKGGPLIRPSPVICAVPSLDFYVCIIRQELYL